MPTNIYQRTAMAAAIAACFPGAALAAGVARVDFAAGSVSAIAPDGRSRALSKGSEIEVGETVATQQGRAQLRFADGAYMSLQPQTEFKVEEFKYSGKAEQSDSIVMNLLKGGLRTITGLIGKTNRNAYRLKTDVATIGIRGTEYSVRYTNSIELHVTDGLVSVDNQSGSFTVAGGTTVQINNQQTPPQTTDQKPVLPPETPVQEQEKVTEQLPPPPNPFVAQTGSILTGTHTANWAAAMYEGQVQSLTEQRITLNGEGALTELTEAFDNGEFAGIVASMPGGATIVSGNDGTMAWGRWVGGIVQGDGPFSGNNLDTNSPLHWVVGLPATNMPVTGEGVYGMIGFDASCGFGCTGISVDRSIITVNFGTGTVSLDMALTLSGGGAAGTYSGQESIGALNRANGAIGGFLFISGATGSGSVSTQGFLAGAGATHAGLAWDGFVSGQNGSADFQGVTAHKK